MMSSTSRYTSGLRRSTTRQHSSLTKALGSALSAARRGFDVASVYIENDDPAVAEAAKRAVGERRAAEDQAFADKLAKRPSPNPVERAEIEKARKHGPVYFRRESEPYMTLAIAGTRRDAGVSVAEVNLKLIWDVVSQIKVVLL